MISRRILLFLLFVAVLLPMVATMLLVFSLALPPMGADTAGTVLQVLGFTVCGVWVLDLVLLVLALAWRSLDPPE